MNTYSVYLANNNSHCIKATITITSDGYLTALAEAKRICTLNHPDLYVARVALKEDYE